MEKNRKNTNATNTTTNNKTENNTKGENTMKRKYTANNMNAAWELVRETWSGDYVLDTESTERARYPIYRDENTKTYICDLCARLEVNTPDGKSFNVWIEKDSETAAAAADNSKTKETADAMEERINKWKQLLRTLETAERNTSDKQHNKEYAKALSSVGNACAYAVLGKLIRLGGANTELLSRLRAELARDTHYLEHCANTIGYPIIINRTLGDGLDLAHAAIVAILEETQKAEDKSGEYLEQTYTTKKLSKRVYINKPDSAAYKEVETSPIRQAHRAVRDEISNSRHEQINNKYIYIDEYLMNVITGETEDIYRRLPAGSEIAYEMKDSMEEYRPGREGKNGGGIATADIETIDTVDEIVDKLNLTASRELPILKLRLRGYGLRAIATYLGISTDSVRGAKNRIVNKARKIGLDAKIERYNAQTFWEVEYRGKNGLAYAYFAERGKADEFTTIYNKLYPHFGHIMSPVHYTYTEEDDITRMCEKVGETEKMIENGNI